MFDADGDMPQPAGCRLVRQKVVRKDRVKIEDGVAVETDLVRGADEKFDRVLVVEDHLRFEAVPAFGLFAELDQASGIEQRVGVALKAA